MVVSNPMAGKRIAFFHSLSKERVVDSGGAYLNNVGGVVVDKMDFIKDYKFVISFENSSYPGYTTEKIVQPLIVDSIPIYWGNPLIGEDFNEGCFLNYDGFPNEKALFQRMIDLESNEELAVEMLMEPKFPNNQIPSYISETELMRFLNRIFDEGNRSPVAKSYKRFIHYAHRKMKILYHLKNRLFRKNFR
jgi:hypothetical protein